MASILATWTTVGMAWASIEGLSGREAAIAMQRQAASTDAINLPFARAWAGIDASWRVLWGQRFTANAANDSLTVTGPVTWAVDAPVQFANYGGALPSPLVEGTTYYVASAAAGVYTVAATAGGPAIDLLDAGSGTNIINGRAYVLDEPPRNLGERDREFRLICSEGLRYE
jgi:head-tail adaptor